MKRLSLNNRHVDYKRGVITEEVKFKPIDGTQNVVTVQLFDAASGELIEESVTENVVSKHLANQAFNSAFYKAFMNGDSGGTLQYSPAHYLLLSDAVVPESADMTYAEGRFCGYANRDTYSGSSIFRGTYNRAESFIDDFSEAGKAKAHLVFDFPTHAANGTIRSIYLMPSNKQVGDTDCIPWIDNASSYLRNEIPMTGLPSEHPANKFYTAGLCTNLCTYQDAVEQIDYSLYVESSVLTFRRRDWKTLTAYEIIKLKYSDGSPIDQVGTVLCAHFNPVTQQIKALFYTGSSTSLKDRPLAETYYEFTFSMTGSFISSKSFPRSMFKFTAATSFSTYPYYSENGTLNFFTQNEVTGTSPLEYEKRRVTLNSSLNAIAVSTDLNPTFASLLNEAIKVRTGQLGTYTATSSYVKRATFGSGLDYPQYHGKTVFYLNVNFNLKNDFTDKGTGSTGFSALIRYSDLSVFKSGYGNSGQNPSMLPGADTPLISEWYAYNGYSYLRFKRTLLASIPTAHTLLPSNVVKTSANTMKIQYDIIIDRVDTLPNIQY